MILWVLGRLGRELSLAEFESEFAALAELWRLQLAYAEYIGVPRPELARDLDRLRKDIDALASERLADVLGTVAFKVLSSRGLEWIRERSDLSDPTLVGLSLCSLGICVAEGSPEHPVLAVLSRAVAEANEETNGTREILLAYLWSRARPDFLDTPRSSALVSFDELEAEWRSWRASLVDAVGSAFRRELEAALLAKLRRGAWPEYLPTRRAMAEGVLQSRRFLDEYDRLVGKAERDEEWRMKLERLTARLSEAAERRADPELWRRLDEGALLELAGKAVEGYLEALVPPQSGGGTPQTSTDVQRRLESFAEALHDEERLRDQLDECDSVFDTLALFRDRAGDLARQLDELALTLKAEASGGSAYLITFDQVNGRIAKVINRLQPKYRFENYTRFARLGRLRAGETFESFYESFEADLERELEAAFSDVEDALGSYDEQQLQDAKARFLRSLETVSEPLLEGGDVAWKYRAMDPGADESFPEFFDRARLDLTEQLDEAFPEVPSGKRRRSAGSWLQLARTAAVWHRIEVTVQQVSLFHRHDFAMDARRRLGPRLGRSYFRIFRLPPSSARVEIAAAERWRRAS